MDTVSQNTILAMTIKPEMDCAHICNQMQKLMNNYTKINGNLDNVVMVIRLQPIIDRDAQPSTPLIEYKGQDQSI